MTDKPTTSALDIVQRKAQTRVLNLKHNDILNWEYLKSKGYSPAILIRTQLDLLAKELKAKEAEVSRD